MATRRIRGIIFDFDGVLVLSEPVHLRAWSDVGASFERGIPDDFHERAVGVSDQDCARWLAETWNAGVSAEELLTAKRTAYQKRVFSEIAWNKGAREMSRLWAPRVGLAVASNSVAADVVPILEMQGVRSLLRTVVTAEDVKRPKPFPDPYLEAARRMGVAADECLVFEDSKPGAEAAVAAGATLVALTTTYGAHEFPNAVAAIPDFSDCQQVMGRFFAL